MRTGARSAAAALILLLAGCAPASTGTDATVPRPPGAVDAAGGIGDPVYPDLGNAGYDVETYDIGLRFGPDLDSMSGDVSIVAVATETLSSFALDLVGYRVEGVSVDGIDARWTRGDRDLRVVPTEPVPKGSSFTINVRYSGTPEPVDLQPQAYRPGWQRVSAVSGFLLSEPDGASGLFPSNDHPTDRADVLLRVIAPPGLDVVSGGSASVVTTDGVVEHRFALPDVAPYLVPLAVGSFRPVTTAGGVVTWLGGALDLPPAFERQSEILAALEEDLGPYPFDTIGSVIVESGIGAAIETQTMPTYTTVSAGWGERVIAHELAHQWFGDLIALGRWDDIWLNEGFATFFSWRWAEREGGPAAYDRLVSTAWERLSRGSFPPPADPPSDALFNPSVYDRGALTLAALRAEVGDRRFFRFVDRYVASFRGGTVTTASFLAFVRDDLGEEAAALVSRWAGGKELPPSPTG